MYHRVIGNYTQIKGCILEVLESLGPPQEISALVKGVRAQHKDIEEKPGDIVRVLNDLYGKSLELTTDRTVRFKTLS